MKRPIPATGCLSHKDALAALPGIRKNLMYRGETTGDFPMCAEVKKWGRGWAVMVGFQDSVDLEEAEAALSQAAA